MKWSVWEMVITYFIYIYLTKARVKARVKSRVKMIVVDSCLVMLQIHKLQ